MQTSDKLEQLVECLIHVIARAAIPQTDVSKIVGTGPKQVKAFNLCNGKNSQTNLVMNIGPLTFKNIFATM